MSERVKYSRRHDCTPHGVRYQKRIQKALGAEHASKLMTVNNLGLLHAGQGKLAEVDKTYVRALAEYEKLCRFLRLFRR
jgi:hypothetical protein